MQWSTATMRKTELIPVNLAAIRRGDKAADLQLQPYDTLVIKPIPMWAEPGTIEVAGEVRFPANIRSIRAKLCIRCCSGPEA